MGNAYQRVAVGTDGSPSSLLAVDRAAILAAAAHADLLIICAYDHDDRADTTTGASRPGAIQSPSAEQADHALDDDSTYRVVGSTPAEEVLRRAQQRAAASGAPAVETVAVAGQPSDRLVETAAARHADVIVVGNQGLSSLRGRLLGSVPQAVSRHAASDVLIVHTTS